jgi:hypothetical protein
MKEEGVKKMFKKEDGVKENIDEGGWSKRLSRRK